MITPVPTLTDYFQRQYFEPVKQQMPDKSIAECFEVAKENYEQFHGHQLKLGQRTLERNLYGK